MKIKMETAICRAMKHLSDDWTRCDKETGEECRGLKCEYPEHRAIVVLENALLQQQSKSTKKKGRSPASDVVWGIVSYFGEYGPDDEVNGADAVQFIMSEMLPRARKAMWEERR